MYSRSNEPNLGKVQLEKTEIQPFTFEQQYNTFQRSGYAADTGSSEIMGDLAGYRNENAGGVVGKHSKKKRKKDEILNDVREWEEDEAADEDGPWAVYRDDDGGEAAAESDRIRKVAAAKRSKAETAGHGNDDGDARDEHDAAASGSNAVPGVHVLEPDEEDEKWERVNERKIGHVLPPRPARGSQVRDAQSTFHGTAQARDYQGRAWHSVPAGLKAEQLGETHECFIPKRCSKKLTGHTKGVQALEFFPGTGHLLLSASMDGKCKIWDCHSDFAVRRTYAGHAEAVRAINMSNSGQQFLSSGFDRVIRHWDVETGQALGTFSNRKMAYSVKYYPRDNHIFLAACSDNKIYQWDVRSGEMVQEYNHHLQPCNTVTFIDEGRKFVSTSDDKKILVWEFDIPVPIKYIAEPNMHCVPAVSLHPSGQYFAGQSMDNNIVVYDCAEGRVRQVRKKTFHGHNNSGYACQIGFSPNGKFLVSGDGLGKLYFWDWKSTKCYRKFHAHDHGPCAAAVWHPLQPSRVASCGWDGIIKIWE